MAFNSIEFGVFLLAVYSLYRLLGHTAQNRMLLVASYFFYGSWDWRFLSLIALSTVIDYSVGLALGRSDDETRRRRLVGLSVASNLGILGIFKYYGFFAESLVELLALGGFSANWSLIHVVLPVGISFYTFQTMSYTLDIYRRELEPTDRFLDFALFVSFFPQLVAGPIERARHLLPMVLEPRTLTLEGTTRGATLILIGLFKKIVIADGVAPSVDAIFGTSGGLTGSDVWLGGGLFALQIYGDFSGYSDIARGVSKLLGFELMINFRLPDYLYISLGGNRGGAWFTYRNLMLTMILGGLWHGAAWNFVLWGFYQGLLLCSHRAWVERHPARKGALWQAIKVPAFFVLVCYGWILFRATSFAQIIEFTGLAVAQPFSMPVAFTRPPLPALLGIPMLLLLAGMEALQGRANWLPDFPPLVRGAVYALLTWLIIMGLSNAPSEFIYFQF